MRRTHLCPGIADGAEVVAGQQLTGDEKTPLDPKKILEVKGIRETQQYLSDEVQKVYREQGVSIHDKHVEVIVRQMLRRVGVSEPGDSTFLPGQKADAREFADDNRRPGGRGQAAGRGSSRAHGDHQGVAGHRLVAVGGVVPGDHPGAHRGGDRGPERRPRRSQGERDHRQADPGRYRHAALPRHRHRRRPTTSRCRSTRPTPTWTADLDLAAWLADTSAPAARVRHRSAIGTLIGDPAAAEAAVEAPTTDLGVGDATAS